MVTRDMKTRGRALHCHSDVVVVVVLILSRVMRDESRRSTGVMVGGGDTRPGSESQAGQYSGQVRAASVTGGIITSHGCQLSGPNKCKNFLTDTHNSTMRRPRTEETVAQKWEDLKDYERQLEERESSSDGSDQTGAKTNKEKLKQLKCSANKKFSSFKSQISDICRWDFLS